MTSTEATGLATDQQPRPPDESEARLIEVSYSEVACHLRVAGRRLWVAPRPHGMAQVFVDGQAYSFPITPGEAGLR